MAFPYRNRPSRALALWLAAQSLATGAAPFAIAAASAVAITSLTGCTKAYRQSLGTSEGEIYNRIYLTDFNIAWQSTLDALKASPMDVTNREGGYLQSKWVDNTAQKNFTDSFGSADSYQKAQYRFRVTVAKGFYNGRPSVKVAVQKEQLVQRDVLEGFRPIETDGIDERTLLYRIGRIIYMRTRIAALEEEKIRRNLDPNATGGPGGASSGPGASGPGANGPGGGAANPDAGAIPDAGPLPSDSPPTGNDSAPAPAANDPELDGPAPSAGTPGAGARRSAPAAPPASTDPADQPIPDMPEPPPPPAKQLRYQRR